MRIKPMINLYDKQQFSPWDWSFKDTEMTQISTNITNVHQLDLGCPDVAKSNKTVTSGRVKQPVQLGTVVPLLLVPPHRPWSCAASVGPPWNDKRTWSGWIRVCTITISYLYSSLSTYQFELRKCQLLIAGAWKVLKVAQTRQHGQPPSMRTQEKCGHFSSSMTLSCVGGYREGRVVCYWTGLSACHHPQNHSTVFESLHIIYLAQLHHEDPESIPASDSLQLWISRSCLEGTSKRCQVHVLSIRFPSYRPKNAKLFLLIFFLTSILQFPLHFSTFLHPNLSHSAVRIPGCPRHPIRSPTRCPWALETPLQAAPAGLLGLETRPRSPAKQLPEEDRFQRFIHSETVRSWNIHEHNMQIIFNRWLQLILYDDLGEYYHESSFCVIC